MPGSVGPARGIGSISTPTNFREVEKPYEYMVSSSIESATVTSPTVFSRVEKTYEKSGQVHGLFGHLEILPGQILKLGESSN